MILRMAASTAYCNRNLLAEAEYVEEMTVVFQRTGEGFWWTRGIFTVECQADLSII